MWRAAHETDGDPALVLPGIDRRTVHGLEFFAAPERLVVAAIAFGVPDRNVRRRGVRVRGVWLRM